MDAQNETSPPIDRTAYGGFWIRFAANVVDTVVLLIPTLLVSVLYRSATPANNEMEKQIVEVWDAALNFAIWMVYTAVLLSSSWQATIGKRVCGLQVVDYKGRRISFGQATGRYFAYMLSAVFLCIGFLMIACTRRRQGLHDFMVNTLVIKHS